MKVVDLKTDGKSMRFSVAAKIAAKIFKWKWLLKRQGFTEDEINRHWDAAHFLIAIDKMSLWSGKRSWLGRILQWLQK